MLLSVLSCGLLTVSGSFCVNIKEILTEVEWSEVK
jgi:hypothetical protein